MDAVVTNNLSLEIVHGSIMRIVWTGESTAASIQTMADYVASCRKQSESLGRVAIIVARDATGMRRGARRALIPLARSKPWERIAFVGLGFQIEVLMNLLSRAFRSMGMDIAEVTFVETEAEALAWLSPPVTTDDPADAPRP